MAEPASFQGGSSLLKRTVEQHGEGSGAARTRTVCLLLGVGALGLGLVLLPALPPGIWHDDGVYLLLGRALAKGEGLRYVGVPGDPLAPKFPPVYPVVLAGLWRLSENPYGVAQVAGVLNVAFVAASVALTAAWSVALGLPLLFAAGAATMVFGSVELWQTAMVALSEPLFTLAVVAALLVALHVERVGGASWALGLALLLVFALHTRTAGAALVPAAVLGLALRRRWRESAIVAGVCTVAAIPWAVWSTRATEQLPAPLRDILGGYGGWLAERVFADPSAYLASLGANMIRTGARFVALLLPGAGPTTLVVLGPFVVLAVGFGVLALWRRSPTASLALVLLLVEVWLWPFDASRLLVPAVPLAAVAVACAGGWLLDGRGDAPAQRRWVPRAFVVGVAAFAVAAGLRMARGDVAERYYARALILRGAAELIERATPPDAVVGAPEIWAAIPLVTGRRSSPSAPFRPDPTGKTLTGGTPAEQLAVWEAARVEYVFLEHEGRVNGPALELLARSCPGSVAVLGAADEGGQGAGRRILVRLGGDPTCGRSLTSEPSP